MNTTATRRAIYGKLAGDTTLNALLAAAPAGYSKSIFYQLAPSNAAFPFVVFQRQSGRPTESFGDPSAVETDVWMIKAVDKNSSADTVESVQSRVAALLNDAALSVSGSTLMYLRRESDIDYSELAEGVLYRHSGSLYRVITDPT